MSCQVEQALVLRGGRSGWSDDSIAISGENSSAWEAVLSRSCLYGLGADNDNGSDNGSLSLVRLAFGSVHCLATPTPNPQPGQCRPVDPVDVDITLHPKRPTLTPNL
jgi:hypothetical protein